MPIYKRLSNSRKLYAVWPDVSPPRSVEMEMGGDWAVPSALHDVFIMVKSFARRWWPQISKGRSAKRGRDQTEPKPHEKLNFVDCGHCYYRTFPTRGQWSYRDKRRQIVLGALTSLGASGFFSVALWGSWHDPVVRWFTKFRQARYRWRIFPLF